MNSISEKYDPKAIEGKWQRIWDEKKTFVAPNPSEDPLKRPKFYCLSMFPYPSGAIHMGHLRNYSIGDIISRFKRMKGFNVMQPVGWDAFGLPAENAAIQRGVHPKSWTLQNIDQMRGDLKSMGLAYDWSREVATCLPEYFRWEQLFFQRFYKEGIAYKKTGTVNWCESCQTVLANEQVQESQCWRCDNQVIQKDLNQWYFKITLYADQLLNDHSELLGKWPDRVLDMQKYWIGKSTGCRISFALEGSKDALEVFTTRPDTLFGVTFVTIAPLHPLSDRLCTEVDSQNKLSQLRKEVRERETPLGENDEKKGFFTGSYAIHPITLAKVPIWVGDFVVMEYGTGAVMAVPAHDHRDFAFATKYQLPIKEVVVPQGKEKSQGLKEAYVESGTLIDSGDFTGLDSEGAKSRIGEFLEGKGVGKRTIQYRLRDWGVSRQRYWGAPVPVINCQKCGVVLVPEKELPVTLPDDVEFTGKGNPLLKHKGFCNVTCPQCGGAAQRETDTMDTFVESSWYYARYTDPKNDKLPFDKKIADQWLPVDSYIGGIEHACMHLLYSRFFHKVLRDWGYLSGNEPFSQLHCQGMVIKDGAKMSKSKGNVVAPRAIIDRYGADTVRLFSLFAAPPEKDLDWNEKGVEGCHRFVLRVWRLFYQYQSIFETKTGEEATPSEAALVGILRKTHWMIQKFNEDIENNKFNTAISASMELVNEIYGVMETKSNLLQTEEGKAVLREAISALILCLAPFTPHLSEELWQATKSIALASESPFPAAKAVWLKSDTFTLVVQVNGKLRDKIEINKSQTAEEIKALVLTLPKVAPFLDGKQLKQVVYVPERLANIVVAG